MSYLDESPVLYVAAAIWHRTCSTDFPRLKRLDLPELYLSVAGLYQVLGVIVTRCNGLNQLKNTCDDFGILIVLYVTIVSSMTLGASS